MLRKLFFFSMLFFNCSFLFSLKHVDPFFTRLDSFCNSVPRVITVYGPPFVSFDEFHHTLEKFIAVNQPLLSNENSWLNPIDRPAASWFSLDSYTPDGHTHFKPFVEKRIIAPGTSAAFWGDLHGGLHPLRDSLKILIKNKKLDANLKILDPKFYMIFLGDYVDRGSYGLEVLYTLMKLKIKNPENVILVRGNHEDYDVNVWGNFSREVHAKYGTISQALRAKIYALYDFLPIALYWGIQEKNHVRYLQCCHGGLEFGYNCKALLETPADIRYEQIHMLLRHDELQVLPGDLKAAVIKALPERSLRNIEPKSPIHPSPIGLMWSDFLLNTNAVEYLNGRGFVFGQSLTEELLRKASGSGHTLQCIMRAHQHHGEMLERLKQNKGVVSLWDNKVFTLFSTSDIPYYNFHFVSFLVVRFADHLKKWKRHHYWIHIPAPSQKPTSKWSDIVQKVKGLFAPNK